MLYKWSTLCHGSLSVLNHTQDKTNLNIDDMKKKPNISFFQSNLLVCNYFESWMSQKINFEI